MITLAAVFLGSPVLAWIVGAIGGLLTLMALVERRHLREQARQLEGARETVADDLWQIEAAGEARLKAEASTQAKSRFIATISHEVRTPLNGVLGMAELLGATPLDPEQTAYVEAIHASGRALTALIEEVLDVTRIEAGKLDLAHEPFDLHPVIEGVAELLAPRAQDKGLEIASFIAPDVPARVVGDAGRLRQILLNLAGNAVKFTDRGGVGIRVATAPSGQLTVTVADTGPGVAPERRSAIFEEFQQGDAASARRHGGSGLGLTITRHLVGLMNGGLTLSDGPGGGSVFGCSIDLPAAPDSAPFQPELPDLDGRGILIAAPPVFQAAFLAQALGAAGARVTIAATVDQALAHLQGHQVDILLVDCALGEDAARRIGDAAGAAGVGRGIVLFSPFERRAFGQKLAAVFDGWLVKPVRARSLAVRLAAQDALEAPRAMPAPTESKAMDLRILLAEDNEINTLVMLKMLDRIGAEVTHVADGAVALNAALAAMRGETRAFDTILLDISMPGLDGRETARLLRRAERGASAPPTRIVALTAYAFEDDRQACFDAGIDEFLTKPIDLARLRAALLAPRSEDAAPEPLPLKATA